MKQLLLLAFISGMMHSAYGQATTKSLAIIPLYLNNKKADIANQELRKAFAADYSLVNDDQLCSNLETNADFNNFLNELFNSTAKNVYEDLPDEKVRIIRTNTDNADLLILSKVLNQKTITKPNLSGVIKLKGEFLIVDLDSGQTITIREEIKEKYDYLTKKTQPPYSKLFARLLSQVQQKYNNGAQ